ncbi:MAG: SsrA-binding protein SmpB [Cyclobacteriaceae bacterium]|nr:SsrA-binding protein SmpB [Cyclobacteriaceae bacterium]
MKKNKAAIFSNNINIRNKQASFNFEFLDKYVAGMVLDGTEIKSIRMGKVNLTDGHCFFSGGELYLHGAHISPYEKASFRKHDPDRDKKLLLQKKELKKLEKGVNEKGLTIVPVRLFINNRGLAKIEVALAKGKKIHDKRDSIKEKDLKRELDRARS